MNIADKKEKINSNYTKEELYYAVRLTAQLEHGEKSIEEYKNAIDNEHNKFIKNVLSRYLVYYFTNRGMDLPDWVAIDVENENIDIFKENKTLDDLNHKDLIKTIGDLEIREITLLQYRDLFDKTLYDTKSKSLIAYIPHFIRYKEELPDWFDLNKCLEIDFLKDVVKPIKILLITEGIIFDSNKAVNYFINTTDEYKLKIIDIMIKTNRYPSDSKIQSLIIDEVEKNKRFIDKELYNQVMNSMSISNNLTPKM